MSMREVFLHKYLWQSPETPNQVGVTLIALGNLGGYIEQHLCPSIFQAKQRAFKKA